MQKLRALAAAMNQVLFGQKDLIELVLIGVLARGHILLEGLPGLGKTELVKGLSRALDITARRVQFTPDLLPGDITGTPVLQERDGTKNFIFQEGPVFANIMLADEINRASPKTQSALLEAMQERRVTVMGETHALPSPFSCLPPRTPLNWKEPFPCRKPSWIASFSKSTSTAHRRMCWPALSSTGKWAWNLKYPRF